MDCVNHGWIEHFYDGISNTAVCSLLGVSIKSALPAISVCTNQHSTENTFKPSLISQRLSSPRHPKQLWPSAPAEICSSVWGGREKSHLLQRQGIIYYSYDYFQSVLITLQCHTHIQLQNVDFSYDNALYNPLKIFKWSIIAHSVIVF